MRSEQVEYALALPMPSMGRTSLDDLARKMGREPSLVEERIEEMAGQRLIMATKSRKDGLVHLTGNAQQGPAVICNCCSCCCNALRGLIELHNPRSFVKTNFLPQFDHDKCRLCSTCKNICPMDAISMLPGVEADGTGAFMRVEETRCIGCGLCASHCPHNAVSMVKAYNNIPAQTLAECNERYMNGRLW
ncbi:MAG: 4Fe-4S binding protein [Deltaproteobacteria bacterium]|nr:4Fe-4S binding protein [Deltaproteobacteria bacterium]